MSVPFAIILSAIVPLGGMFTGSSDHQVSASRAFDIAASPIAGILRVASDDSLSANELRLSRAEQEFVSQLRPEGTRLQGSSDWHSRNAWRSVAFSNSWGVPSLATSTVLFVWPLVAGGGISSSPGPRIHPISGRGSCHYGQDLDVPMGTPVRAAAAGRVIDWDLGNAAGRTVTLDHGGGLLTSYAHLSSRNVEVGQEVEVGETVGEVGSTGASTGSHLHFEISFRGTRYEPIAWFSGSAFAITC